MALTYSLQTIRTLEQAFAAQQVHRPMRVSHYEAGTQLCYEMLGVFPATTARVRLNIDKFIGGGFAGQVYRVKVAGIDGGQIAGLAVGQQYAMKILLPPSAASCRFRDTLYAVGFQSPFSMQVNGCAIRSGALWQKLIRRACQRRFGSERAVKDIYATFLDSQLGSYGEISEWVEGRQWRFEVDDKLDIRGLAMHGNAAALEQTRSPEYVAKRRFMDAFVDLLHSMGAAELARQYEWWTCKSQPNCMKLSDSEDRPTGGLCALDFRAGLVLLPVLPMSPADVKLIGQGIARGSWVQFDRGNLEHLDAFLKAYPQDFADLQPAIDELKQAEQAYRDSMLDLTHNAGRLTHDGKLWNSIFAATVEGLHVSHAADDVTTARFRQSKLSLLGYLSTHLLSLLGLVLGLWLAISAIRCHRHVILGLIGAVAIFIAGRLAGRLARRLIGRADYRRHYGQMLRDGGYFLRAIRARRAETLVEWLRAGRVTDERALHLVNQPVHFLLHLPCSILPAKLHRMLTDRAYAWDTLKRVITQPLHLYFNAAAREQWLREMLSEGRQKGMLSQEDFEKINASVGEPFIQKYLKSLAVHICMMPVGHLISLGLGIFLAVYFGEGIKEGMLIAAGTLAFFQITPISPGSTLRGLYVLYLVIGERNIKDYNIALPLAFFKYIGYLAFPIQMTSRYPALARFMATHWSTGAVPVVPVFGEHGALLEHAVFDLFYNRPLTIGRRVRQRSARRQGQSNRRWIILAVTAVASILPLVADGLYAKGSSNWHTLGHLWLANLPLAFLAGWVAARLRGGRGTGPRVLAGLLCGVLLAVLHFATNSLAYRFGAPAGTLFTSVWLDQTGKGALWQLFLLPVLAFLGATIEELWVSDREL